MAFFKHTGPFAQPPGQPARPLFASSGLSQALRAGGALLLAASVAGTAATAQAKPPQNPQAGKKATPAQAGKQAGRRQASKASGQPAQAAQQSVTLDFANAEIDAVARTMAVLTGRNVVVDPRVKGQMTLTSTQPVSPAQAMRLFATQLRTQGFALVERDGMSLVLPEADAKLQSGSVSAGARPAGGGQVQTQIFRLTHENANDLVPILRPLISPNNTINVNPGTNALVITDYGDNLQRIGRIIAALDVANATDMEIVPLHYAVASDLAPLVAQLLDSGAASALPGAQRTGQNAPQAQAVAGGGYRTTLVPEPRSNAIIVRAANASRLQLAKKLIQQLDQPAQTRPDGGGNIHVVYLKNAEAAKLAVTLRAALAALPGQSQGAGAATAGAGGGAAMVSASSQGASRASVSASSGGGNSLGAGPSINAEASNQPSTGGQIQADPATNSLIISAPDPVYRELRAVIDKLDQRRAQVFVESLIAEVRADRAADFGVQWQVFGRNGNGLGVLGTNFSTPSATNQGGNTTNLLNFAAQFINYGTGNWSPTVMPGRGFNLALGGNALGVLANFIQSTGAGNVLSTPTLLTLDNEEAKIIVGQNVPIVTGSYTATGAGTTAVNPFQTYDRQDVGLTLRVRPQISEDGTIKMVIYQEVSSVVQATATRSSGPTTNKRAIESSVLINDGSIVVLGGLLEDTYSESVEKVPGLGDIPLVGNLFKSQSRSYVKTNLMVFLRPVIVRDAASTEAFSLSRYDLLRASQQANQPEPSAVLQVNKAPVMPPQAPVLAPGPAAPEAPAQVTPQQVTPQQDSGPPEQPGQTPPPAPLQAPPPLATLPGGGWRRPAPPPPLATVEMPAAGERNYDANAPASAPVSAQMLTNN